MTDQPAAERGSSSLPGLAKFFLFQTYVYLLVFFGLQLVFFTIGGEVRRGSGFEFHLWQMASFGLFLWSLATPIGIHLRAPWARANCLRYLPALGCFTLAGALRLLFFIKERGLSFSYYSYSSFPVDALMLAAPGLLLCLLPQFYAWAVYFKTSPKLKAALNASGDAAEDAGEACSGPAPRPLGVALLQLLCATLLAYYFMFFLNLILSRPEGQGSGIIPLALVIALPQMIFPSILLGLIRSPGRRRRHLHFCLAAWILTALLWGSWTGYQLLGLFGIEPYNAHSLLQLNTYLPVQRDILAMLLAALWWRLADSPEERSWFTDREPVNNSAAEPLSDNRRLLVFLTGYLLVFVLTNAMYRLPTALSPESALPKVKLAVTLAIAALGFLAVYWQLQRDSKAKPASGAFLAACVLLVAGIIFEYAKERVQQEHMLTNLFYLLPHFTRPLAPLAVGLACLAREGKEPADAPAEGTPLPVRVFLVFCLYVLCVKLLPRLVILPFLMARGEGVSLDQGIMLLLGAAPDSAMRSDDYFSGGTLFSPDFALAFIVFPLLAIRALRRRASRPALACLIGLWLLVVQSCNYSGLTRWLIRSLSGYEHSTSWGGDPATHFTFAVVLLFGVYLLHSNRLAVWLRASHP
ncbi:MAG: hypothetical protein LBM00_11315 [Deltaproteobacteria bacterium]|jgi:hypothetical protein|nr:hypothetical protein [Deltaproteobacteria bacterium]